MSYNRRAASVSELRSVKRHESGNRIYVTGTSDEYVYDGAATGADDGDLIVKPSDVSGGGRWLKVTEDPAEAIAEGQTKVAEVSLTANQVKALVATPQTLVAAPGEGLAIVPELVVFELDYNSVAYTASGGTDAVVRFASGSTAIMTVEATGNLTVSADRVFAAAPAYSPSSPQLLKENSAVQLTVTGAELATGNSPVKVRTYYKVVPVTL